LSLSAAAAAELIHYEAVGTGGRVQVRKRTAIVGAVVVGLCALAWPVWAVIQRRPANQPPGEGKAQSAPEPARQPDDLSAEDEAALRAIVSEHFLATAYWAPGGADLYDPTKRFRVLVLPRGVREIFERKPVGTLRVLKSIIQSGSSADARAAIAYAHAAVGYANDDPVPLLHAHSYAYYPTAKEFEDVNPVIPKTYRQFAVEEIEALITDVAKRQQEKPPALK
jgi:hypothetical protein